MTYFLRRVHWEPGAGGVGLGTAHARALTGLAGRAVRALIMVLLLAVLVPFARSSPITVQPGSKLNIGYLRAGRLWVFTNASSGAFVFSNITHVIEIGGNGVASNGSVYIGDVNSLTNYAAAAHAHGKKISICISGSYTSNGGTLAGIFANAALRTTLISNLLQVCRQYNLDGVDFDWEYPVSSELANYSSFLKQLRSAAPPGFLISAAIGWWSGAVPAAASPAVDWFFVMAYTDCSPQVSYVGAVSDMSSALANGIPASKLVMGLPIYGANSSCATIGYAGIIGTNILDPSVDSFNGWSFNGPTTIADKTQYVYANGFAGIGWWDLSLDTYDSRSLLLAAANQAQTSAFGNAVVWSGGGTGAWSDGYDWSGGIPPATNQYAFFGLGSTNQLNTLVDAGRAVRGVMIYEPPGLISLGGQTLALGDGGVDMQWSTQDAMFSNNVSLSAAQTWAVGDGRRLAVQGNIAGTGPLTKTGWGKLILTGTNSWAGGTTITAGTLQLGDDSAGHDGALTGNIVNNGSLVFDLIGNQPMTGSISGIGSLTKAGGGMLTLSGNSTYSGGTLVNDGTLDVTGTNSATGAITITNGTLTVTANWDNNGAITINHGGTLTVTSGGLYRYADGSAHYAGNTVTINRGGTLNVNSWVYNGDGGLGGNPDYGTYRQINGGTINVTGGTQSSGQDFYVANGGSGTFNMVTAGQTLTLSGNANSDILLGGPLTIGGAGSLDISEKIGNNTGAGSITKTGAGTLTLSGANTFSGNVTNGAGTMVSSSSGNGSSASSLGLVGSGSSGRFIVVNAGATSSWTTNNVLGGSGMTASNEPTIVLDGGTLSATRYNALGNLVLNGGTLNQSSTDTGSYLGYQFIGTVRVGGSSISTISTGNGKADHLLGGGVTTFDVASTGGGGVDLSVSAALTDGSGDYSGAGNLVKTGNGTMSVNGANTYTGTTVVSNGTLLVNGSLASASTVAVAATATLGGTGTLGGSVVLNGSISPGTNDVGTLTTGAETWNGGANYVYEINSTNATGSDRLNLTGALTISATAGNRFTVNLVSLTSSNTPGLLANFDPSKNYSWSIATASSLSGFDLAKFVVNTRQFGNAFAGTFSVTNSGSSLLVNYVAPPPIPPAFTGSALLPGGIFQLNFTGQVGQAYSVRRTNNLLAPILAWPVFTNGIIGSSGAMTITDTVVPGNLQQFYQITSP